MASRKKLYVVCYDIEKNKRRNKFAKYLESEGGERVNYSVFEIMLNKERYHALVGKIPNMIAQQRDRVIVYPICRQCYKSSEFIPERGPMPAKPLVEA